MLQSRVAILDINLGPNVPDGVDAFNWLMDHGFQGKILFFTGHARTNPLVAQAVRNGVEILEKPVHPDKIVSTVTRAPQRDSMSTSRPVGTNDAALGEQPSWRAIPFYNVHLSEREAWLGATVAALFTVLGMLLELVVVRKAPGVSATPAAVSACVALVLLIVLFIQRENSVNQMGIYFLFSQYRVGGHGSPLN